MYIIKYSNNNAILIVYLIQAVIFHNGNKLLFLLIMYSDLLHVRYFYRIITL